MVSKALEILHRTDRFVAVDKPAGLLTHRTELASRESDSCMARLRDQLGSWVYPVHRLDRATSGVLLFALDSDAAEQLSVLLRGRIDAAAGPTGPALPASSCGMSKRYLAVVRGHAPQEGLIDRPLTRNFEKKASPLVEASTWFKRLATVELPYPVGRYASARYSLLEAEPFTGRRHQIRRHLASLSHPVLGDTVRGDGKHNRFVRERYGIERLLLHADLLRFNDPFSGNSCTIQSKLSLEFKGLVSRLFQTEIVG